jgi:hypothetical protein
MTRLAEQTIQNALKVFRRKKVLTLTELVSLLGCAAITARGKLKQWQTRHSLNHNGKYYVLPDIPEFDSHGLWQYRDIRFSRYGNLNQTVVSLIRDSPAGLTAQELGALLALDPRSFLSPFRRHPEVVRQKHQGRFVYFSRQPAVGERQQRRRSKMISEAKIPSAVEAVVILVEMIKHPQWTPGQVSAALQARGCPITPAMIESLLAQEGVPIKKTPDSS